MSLRVLPLLVDFAEAFAEYRVRTRYTPFSTRQKFERLDDTSVEREADRLRDQVCRTYGVVNDEGEVFVVGRSIAVVLPMTEERLALVKRAAGNEGISGYVNQALSDRLDYDAPRDGAEERA